MYMARGLALIFAGGKTINVGLPRNFILLGRTNIGPLPVPLVIMIIIVALFVFIQNKTILGKYSYAIGGNKTTAILSGINVSSVVIFLYILVGILAGFSGTIMAARLGVGHPNVGIGFEFDVIVAILIGGTSLSGGEGSVLGMVIGAFIVGFLSNALNLLGMHTFYQYVVKGVVLILAVILDLFIKERIK
jgi:ribose/xylose/arabinose/galactoside ABC-type transport system permease subunit